jgi:hypothetical protein
MEIGTRGGARLVQEQERSEAKEVREAQEQEVVEQVRSAIVGMARIPAD